MLKPPHPEASKCLLSIFIRVIWHPNRDLNPGCSNDDADPGQQDPLWLQYSNTHRLQKSCGGKGTAQPLSQEESISERLRYSLKRRAPRPLQLTGFYCFSRPLTSKMVLLYYANVCFGWLPFADKGEGAAEHIKGGYLQCKGRNGPIGYAPYLEGLAQILGR